MTISKRMAAALMAGGQYRTKKYLYSLGVNMYGQEIVQRMLHALVYGEDLVTAPSCKLFDGVKGAEGQFVFVRRHRYELRRLNLGAAHLCRLRRRCGLPCQNSSSKSFLWMEQASFFRRLSATSAA